MSTTLTPPPVVPGTPAEPPRPSSGGSRAVAIVVIVLGGIVLLGAAISAAVGTIASASVHTSTRTADAAGVEELDVDAAAGTLRVEFSDVREAELEVTSSWGAGDWRLERDGDTLQVSSPDRDWFGWRGWFGDGGADAVLRLPASLEGLDADISLAAGEFVTDGEFGQLDLSLAAGSFDVTGSAESLSADVSAGRGTLELDGVREADLTVSAGSLDATLTGTAPDAVELDVSAGSLRLTVPEGEYDVRAEVSAGQFDNSIGSTPGASRTIDVQVSAGQAVLKSGS
ncbi:hypothetical protein ASF40_18210 [Microbacterium sp. Leaf288]|uniref:DUF4097 family beta strand repeat-containing protein n=1 Tax=Microbacterium sp. Leaf288 TaxID=1736323 RepID=UPI0006F5F9D4|nr:DUF4097 family beta strand repeat-containing protein [Microbacterium sp. Leaf288]KQP68578.1 hypothetical protein ASF40_18210 [Microbacterium sp. Leaf288]